MPERAIQEMKNHLNSWREKFVHALFRHTCTLIACRNGEEKKQEVIGKNDFTLTKTVTILFVHERGNSVHACRGYAARSVPEFPRSWTNNIVTITSVSHSVSDSVSDSMFLFQILFHILFLIFSLFTVHFQILYDISDAVSDFISHILVFNSSFLFQVCS